MHGKNIFVSICRILSSVCVRPWRWDMGCASSADEGRDGAQEMAPAGPAKTNKNKASSPSPSPKAPAAVKSTASSSRSPYGPLSETQYVSRLAHSGTSREVQVALSHGQAYTLQWAYASQRGYYPDQPNKARARGALWVKRSGRAPPL